MINQKRTQPGQTITEVPVDLMDYLYIPAGSDGNFIPTPNCPKDILKEVLERCYVLNMSAE